MKIKNKLRLGFSFLFVVLISFGTLALYYLSGISANAEVILKNNYESLEFCRAMRAILDETDLPLPSSAVNNFSSALRKAGNNITEAGEEEAVKRVEEAFKILKDSGRTSSEKLQAERAARAFLRQIEEMNMKAIVRKSEQAKDSVKDASILLAVIGSVSFLILFTFSVNFPGFIADPVNEVVEGIKEISKKNYQTRLQFETNDEFSAVAQAFNQMASRLDEWEHTNLAQVISEKSRIETIIRQMQDAVIGLNEKAEIIFLNPVAEKLLNLSEKKIVGNDAFKLAEKNDLLNNILQNRNKELPLKIFADDKESYFLLESHKIIIPASYLAAEDSVGSQPQPAIAQLERGEPVGEVYILRNITQFRELDQAKTNFIATISHELKTPIASIKMSSKLLNDDRVGQLNQEQSELLNHITEDTDRLLKITSELLDLSQVETGNIQLNFMEAEPQAIVDYALNSVRFPAEQKKISLDLQIDDDLPKVLADLEKTAWVLVNFLSNAIRYSSENSKIIIGIKTSNNGVNFSVKDFGKGIEAKYLDRLFERYFQVPTDGRNKSGSGLGLAISKDFIEAQKGEIFVQSELGAGSTFGFWLPKILKPENT